MVSELGEGNEDELTKGKLLGELHRMCACSEGREMKFDENLKLRLCRRWRLLVCEMWRRGSERPKHMSKKILSRMIRYARGITEGNQRDIRAEN